MEETEDKPIYKLNGLKNGIIKDNITVLDLSRRNITDFNDEMKLPHNLKELNISHNRLENIPEVITKLKCITTLDISFNTIKYFDERPGFCDTIEYLNISSNNLHGPPAWIWFDLPKKLTKLNISSNYYLTNSFKYDYNEKLIKCKTFILDIKIDNCKLNNYIDFLGTFPKAKSVKIGNSNISYIASNRITEFPCKGLIECCDIEILDLNYTYIFTIKPNIDIYKSLIYINLAQNEISNLPNEFSNLECLEVCILSCNKLLYLPDDFLKLKKLHTLCLDSNTLCMLPDVGELPKLKKLDLYDNCLCEIIDLSRFEEIDVAQNYLDEPSDDEYISKREKLRLHSVGRWDGRKQEKYNPGSVHSLYSDLDDHDSIQQDCDNDHLDSSNRPPSSAEDWDSDEYWVPYNIIKNVNPPQSRWIYFIKQKMEDGNFCPIDLHTVPVAERVNYEKTINPPVQNESDGQFDDYSIDES